MQAIEWPTLSLIHSIINYIIEKGLTLCVSAQDIAPNSHGLVFGSVPEKSRP